MSNVSRRRFPDIRSAIVARDRADATVEPWSRFTVRIEAGRTTTVRAVAHGDLLIENAIIVATSYRVDKSCQTLTDEAHIERMSIRVGTDMLENGRDAIGTCEFPLVADLVLADGGYDVVRLVQPHTIATAA